MLDGASQLERFFSVAGAKHVVTQGFEIFADNLAQRRIVFDQENCFRSTGNRGLFAVGCQAAASRPREANAPSDLVRIPMDGEKSAVLLNRAGNAR